MKTIDHADQASPRADDAIRALVTRLSRAHPSGGKVIERAAILASGSDLDAVVKWIAAHDGQPETVVPAKSTSGLYGSRTEPARPPRRYLLPAEALGASARQTR